MDKFQLSLIGIGSLGLIGLFGYSKWQEARARKHAENVFGSEHRDVLLDDAPATPDSPAAPHDAEFSIQPRVALEGERIEPSDRMEPSFLDAGADELGAITPTVLNSATLNAPDFDDEEIETLSLDNAPATPREVDERVDCVVRFDLGSPRSAHDVLAAVAKTWPQGVNGVRWYGLPAGSNAWREIKAGPGQLVRVVAALQLASRAGAVSEAEVVHLLSGVSEFAAATGAQARSPDPRSVLAQAAELDQFCAGVDVLIGVNVIAHEQPFPGTKIRGLAEAAGMKLGADGVYRAFDEDGTELFGLANLEAPAFSAESIRTLQTRGLTLTLDVPRAAHGKVAFERMLLLSRQLADALKGRLVDDNRAPLADAALAVIREQIGKFQKQMSERSIAAGSPVAQRVFS